MTTTAQSAARLPARRKPDYSHGKQLAQQIFHETMTAIDVRHAMLGKLKFRGRRAHGRGNDPSSHPARHAWWPLARRQIAPLEGRKVLATHVSVPVAQDIAVINKASQNLHAELLLRLLGKVHGADGSFAEGARVVRQFLIDASIEDADFFFYDGSGMSNDDRMAPRAFTQLLAYASRQSWGPSWRDTLPVAGVDGTLINRFKSSPLKGHLWAKTGTHNEANALSGYLTAASGKTLAFSILVNGHRPGSEVELNAIDRIAEAIASAE